MAASYIANVPKLKGRENFDEWSFAAENLMILEGLGDCISGTEKDLGKVAKAKAKLILTIDTSLYVHIKEVKSAEELWNKLQSMFDDKGFSRRISLLRSLISLRLENCDSMSSYVNQMIETAQRLRSTGFKIDDEWIGSLLLAGLPERFAPMIMAIEHSGAVISADSIKTKLLDMEDDTCRAGSAFVGKFLGKKKASITKNIGVPKKEIRCYNCQKLGHFKNKCPQLKVTNKKDEKTANDDVKTTKHAFNTVFLSSGDFSKNDWYIDSGASAHLTVNKHWLKNVTRNDNLGEITVANNNKLSVICKGDLDFQTVVNNELIDVEIKNVLCVPELTTNLLSVSQMITKGNSVIFEKDGCKIYNRCNELVGTAKLVNNVYKLDIKKGDLKAMLTVDNFIWHRRLGHINQNDLDLMKKGAVIGLQSNDTSKFSKQNCIVCCEGKQNRLPFPDKGNRATELLQIIHSDVCGPMETKSIGGAKYFLIFEDDLSKMAFIYFLKHKDEVFERFKEFKALVENQKDNKIKILRTDNGGEFCNNNLEKFLKNCGIIHQTSNAYTPEQNGNAERLNRTIVEKARCLLFDAKLDDKFWAEACNTAVYLRNRCVSSSLNGKTPFEIWYDRKPDVSSLKIFGSTVMTHIPKQKRTKWDRKAEKMILVGYGENTKGYRIYNERKNEVIISREVTVMEDFEEKIKLEIDEDISDSVEENVEESKIERITENTENEFEENSEEDEEDIENNHVENVRRSQRKRKPKNYEDYVTYMSIESPYDQCPTSVEEALASEKKYSWKKAIEEELKSFDENEAWEVVEKPEKGTIVQSKWVFKKKRDASGEVQYRARLVAKGFIQKKGIDYEEIFSPVVRHSTLRFLIALSVNMNLDVIHLDVKCAFLNGYLEKDVFMYPPEGLIIKDQTKVLKLKKAIYGLKQSSRAWYKRVDKVLFDLDYKKSEYEPCLFVKRNNDFLTIIALYVDDFLVFTNDKSEEIKLKLELSNKFKIKDLGQAKTILGMRICVDKVNEEITIDQTEYIENLLSKFNLSNCKTHKTPLECNINLEKPNNCDDSLPYQQLIGSLMYLSVLTRPDICYSVSYMSQFNNCFNGTHWKQAKRILKYLKATKNYCMKFTKTSKLELECFVDSDWGSNAIDRKSYSGFFFKLSNCAISWESRKQTSVALSSTEAEYVAMSEATKEAIYLRNLLNEITGIEKCITIFNDNQSAQKLAMNPIFHKRSKHVDIKYHFIRNAISDEYVRLCYLETAEMPADILTKSLGFVKHNNHVLSLGINDCTCKFVRLSGGVENVISKF